MPDAKKPPKPKLLGTIVERSPKRGEAKWHGRTEAFGMDNASIARINAGLQIADSDPLTDGELGFSTRVLVQATLPHSAPQRDQRYWVRKNGFATLTVEAGTTTDPKTGERSSVGLPYGSLPRLIMIYLCSEARRLQAPEIGLGDNLTDFMVELGLATEGRRITGGSNGSITRLKNQAYRLVKSRMEYEYNDGHTKTGFASQIAKKWFFFWDQNPDQSTLFPNSVTLSSDFFQEIMANPVPLHLGAVAALKSSPFDLDLYTWLTYRVASLKRPAVIKWSDLQLQLGSDYNDPKDFAKNARRRLASVGQVWTKLEYEAVRGGFRLSPCEPSVPRLKGKADK